MPQIVLQGNWVERWGFEIGCSISMGDEAVKIFLNVDGTMDDVSRELKAFLDYVAGQKPKDSYVEKLEEAVQSIYKCSALFDRII